MKQIQLPWRNARERVLMRAKNNKIGKSTGSGGTWLDGEMTSPFHLFQFFRQLHYTDAVMMLIRISSRVCVEVSGVGRRSSSSSDSSSSSGNMVGRQRKRDGKRDEAEKTADERQESIEEAALGSGEVSGVRYHHGRSAKFSVKRKGSTLATMMLPCPSSMMIKYF
ncbi:hypothetical protein PRIPAC_83446 [Pristionchus pacificus]|uniref:Uncharacterized protein n=1 Tax=Pristionchus pacificus TaxID=54126 RepID=A0A2A6BMJ6_PRIPA|nr:hypothetical protein PRIPAC_83446 [Pristionchus pacificus]|eukprot:PDM67068.1 hypothetical protein PRIPAC_48485 [Pristionchus pacificus]